MESVLVTPQDDGTSLLSIAGPSWIEEWVVFDDGSRVLVASVVLA